MHSEIDAAFQQLQLGFRRSVMLMRGTYLQKRSLSLRIRTQAFAGELVPCPCLGLWGSGDGLYLMTG